jgi:hypothetical protein
MTQKAVSSSMWMRRPVLFAGALLTIGLAAPLSASVITYEETIQDTKDPLVFFDTRRDLERSQTLGDGSAPLVELDDAVIVTQNSVSDSFGRWVSDPVTYTHLFLPVGPVLKFDSASLQITAASVSGTPTVGPPPDLIEFLFGLGTPDDPVSANGQFLGYLNPANPFKEVMWQFSTGDSALIGLLLADDRLNVTVTPLGPGFIGEKPDDPSEPNGDKIAVRSSTLSVTYRVPEPTSMTLLLAAGLAAALVRKRSGSRRS